MLASKLFSSFSDVSQIPLVNTAIRINQLVIAIDTQVLRCNDRYNKMLSY
jgi:hypothetical protein